MKTWLRLTLVLFTVGGGFAGLGMSTEAAANYPSNLPQYGRFGLVLLAIVFGFVAFTGLRLVYSPRPTRLLQIALAVQIPYVTWPFFMYKFSSGAAFYILWSLGSFEKAYSRISEHSAWWFSFGADFSMGGAEPRHWTIGFNFVALILFILARHAAKKPESNGPVEFPGAAFEPSSLKNWQRLPLIVVLVGGGFTSFVLAINEFSDLSQKGPLGLSVFAAMILLPAIEIVAGLFLVRTPEQTRLLRTALGLQIPWITSPLISFQFMCGAGLWIVLSSGPLDGAGKLVGETIRWRGQYGAFESIGVREHLPWSLGVNFVAVLLFFLLPPVVRSRHPVLKAEPTFWDSLPKPPAS